MHGLRNILSRRTERLAVDLAADAIRVLGLEGGSVRTSISVPLASGLRGGAWGDALRAAVRAAGVRGAECRVTLPSRFFRMETTGMPPMSEPERVRSAKFEAMDRFGVDPEASIIRHAVLGQDGRQVLLMAADAASIGDLMEPLVRSGLLPCSAEPAAWAAVRGAMTWGGLGGTGRVAFVCLEPEVTSLAMIVDGTVESFRCLHGQWGQSTVGATPRQHAPEGDIALEPEADGWRWSALAEEMVRALRACGNADMWPERLVLSGAGAEDASLQSTLSGVCGVQVALANSERWMPSTTELKGDRWAAAFGSSALDTAASDRRAA